ncbi:MAG: GTP-binding protein [Candidatus Hecatellales archaeon ex4484_218]|nr:MAG: GTP-binding protein [Candidatus Hecatellales archaeon ex4484_218]
MIPKHKHTQKLCVQIKRQIATLKTQIEEEKKRRKTGRNLWFIEKHGAAQLILAGFTKSGKSSIISRTTNAKPTISDYPFTTVEPVAGMLPYQDIAFQLVEAPSFQPTLENSTWNLKVLSLIRNADGLILTLNLQEDPCWQFNFVRKILENSKILVEKPKARVVVERKNVGLGIQVLGRLLDGTYEDVKQLLNSYKIYNATVKIYGEATLDDVEDAIFEGVVYKPTLILANKIDLKNSNEKLENLKRMVEGKIRILPVSCKTGEGLEKLGFEIFSLLDILRVYTKHPAKKEPSTEPIILKNGATVLDVAKEIHSSLYKKFGYAKIWGPSAKYEGEKVGGDHMLMDGDIVEIHSK